MPEVPTVCDWAVPDRLPVLGAGAHPPGSPEPCAMEAAAWLAGEPWSDEPASVHPVIAAIARWVNDSVDDGRRQELWPMIMASVGTARHRSRVLHWRLRTAAGKAKRAALIAHDPPLAWRETLARYRQLTAGQAGTPVARASAASPASGATSWAIPSYAPEAAPGTGAEESTAPAPPVITGTP